jgi:ABC-2 type transport system permease protein
LLTSPVRDTEVVLGKYIAALSLYVDILALTLVYPIILFSMGNPDPGPVLGGYLGVLLFGGALLAVGVLTSSVTENQVIAAVLSFAVYLGFLLLAAASTFGDLLPVKELQELVSSLNIFEHLDNFLRGLVNSYSLVFFLSVTAISLFLATRVLEMRRWR